MSYDPLPDHRIPPVTPGMIFTIRGDRVTFSHRFPQRLPDGELMMIAQLNEAPPVTLLHEIARRGLNAQFKDLWQRGLGAS